MSRTYRILGTKTILIVNNNTMTIARMTTMILPKITQIQQRSLRNQWSLNQNQSNVLHCAPAIRVILCAINYTQLSRIRNLNSHKLMSHLLATQRIWCRFGLNLWCGRWKMSYLTLRGEWLNQEQIWSKNRADPSKHHSSIVSNMAIMRWQSD